MFDWETYRQIRYKYFGEKRPEARINYRKYKQVKDNMNCESAKINTNYVSLGCTGTISGATANWVVIDDCCAKPAYPPAPCTKVCPTKEVENTMTETDIVSQRRYFNDRTNSVFYDKENENIETFRIHNSEYPRTYKELIDAIKNGLYTLDEKRTKVIEAEPSYACSMTDGMKFKLPTAPDREGYSKADKALRAAKQAARDQIAAATDGAAMLKAVEDFKAWTPTVGNA